MEALRVMPPAGSTQFQDVIADVKVGKVQFKKGDSVAITLEALGLDPTQWQRPLEFLPERHDSTSPLFLTPDGKKRHPNALIPFMGGPRVCFGKTLAENTMKISISYITQVFEAEFEDPKFMNTPLLSTIDMSHKEKCWLKLKLRK